MKSVSQILALVLSRAVIGCPTFRALLVGVEAEPLQTTFHPREILKIIDQKITYLPIKKFIIYGIEKGRCFMVPNAQMVSDFQEIHPQDRIFKT